MRRRAPSLLFVVLVACHSAPSAAAPSLATATATAAADVPDLPVPAAGKAFLPADYEGELFVDWEALRECGLLDRVLRLPTMERTFEVFARDYGARADDFLRLRTAYTGMWNRDEVSLAEITAGSGQGAANDQYKSVTVGPHQGLQRGSRYHPHVVLWPTESLAVSGPRPTVEAMVAGQRPAGGPHPDLRPLLAGRGVLAQMAYGRFGRPVEQVRGLFGELFGDADDPVDFVRIRLATDDEGDLVLSVTLRFQHGTTGLRAAAHSASTRLAAALDEARLAPLRPLLVDIAIAREGRDLCGQLRLGGAQQAVRTIERALLALVTLQAESSGR